MEEKLFGILIETVIGYTSEEILIEDQGVTTYQKRAVTKGTLLTVMSHGEAKMTADRFDPPHNYKCVIEHETVTLYCKPTVIYQLTKSERNLLNGVQKRDERIEVLHNLDWVGKLHLGSCVYVTIPTIPVPVRGVVSHIGQLKGEVGTKFGIELQVPDCSKHVNIQSYCYHTFYRKGKEKGPVMVHFKMSGTLNVSLIVQCLSQWISLHKNPLLMRLKELLSKSSHLSQRMISQSD